MLQAIASLSLPQLGYAEVLKPAPLLDNPRQTTDIFDGLELKLNDGTRLELGSTVFHHHGIIGRGTCVVQAKCIRKRKGNGADDGAWDGPLIVKLSWPAKSRMSENNIIQQARNAANNDEHCWVLKQLPDVLHAKDQYVNLLSQALIGRMGAKYEDCVLRIVVQEELYPITEQMATNDLAQSFCEAFWCMYPSNTYFVTIHHLVIGYRWLFEVLKILHWDISIDNLMIRKKGLNDFDLAVSADINSMLSKHHTGTKPFMVIDLIHPDPTVHMYRHDLESMFYVLVWITSRFHDGQEVADPPLQE